MEPFTILGAIASIMQLLGCNLPNAFTSIMEAPTMVSRNKEECELLAQSASSIQDLLRRLQESKMIKDPDLWKSTERLKMTLVKASVLVSFCQDSSCVYRLCISSDIADQLNSVHDQMDRYVSHLTALISTLTYDQVTRPLGNLSASGSNQDGAQVSFNTGMFISHKDTGLKKFTFSQLKDATDNFSPGKQIGVGAFSTVYEGQLKNGHKVAVKRANYEGEAPFHHLDNEIEIIPNLRHTNIVKILGCCIQKSERILVFEHMPKGSLDSLINSKRAKETPLDWPKRSQIVEGIVQGALYLHNQCEPRIIHGDLKPGNILLDSDLKPKICDFGISKVLKPGKDKDCTDVVMGSSVFIAPEYKQGGCFSVKSDVYSFGVTLLQIISGKNSPPPPVALSVESRKHGPLNKWAWDFWREGSLVEFIDPSLHDETNSSAEMHRWVQIALLCVQENPEERPSMWDVLLMLSCNSVILPEPNLPAYC